MGCAKSREQETAEPQNKPQKQTKDTVIVQQKGMQGQKSGKFKDSYTFIKMLGKGAFGEVRSAQHKLSQKIFAVKLIRKVFIEPEEEESIMQEIEIMKNLDHPNCIKVIEYYNESDFLYIVMEFCTGGELYERIGQSQKLTESYICSIMKKILTAINYCHSNKIVHRDLKPENILFFTKDPNSELKIADFGLSAMYGKGKLEERVGTPLYMAPEVINRNYSEKCDIWSIGVILFVLFTGEPPFFAQTKEDLFIKIKNHEVSFNHEVFKSVSEECKDFIKFLLIKNQDKRPDAHQALQHKWFEKFSEQLSAQQVKEQNDQLGNYVHNLSTFRTQSKLQKATWIFFTTYLTADDEQQRLAKAFQKLDINGDGRLSKAEILLGINFFTHTDNTQQDLEELMKQLDNDQSGKIDYNEFVSAAINREKMLTSNNIQLAFKMLDQNKDGKISVQEYKNMFSGQYISDQVWSQLFEDVDTDGDKELSFEEFKNCLEKLSTKLQKR